MARKSRPDGWWYPWIFVAGMAVVVAVNGVLAVVAFATFSGLDTQDYYEKGLVYNQDLAAARAQAARGWRFEFALRDVRAEGDVRRGEIVATFATREGRPLDNLEVRALILRPTVEGFDREVPLAAAGNGIYTGRVDFPLPGQWTVRIHAYRGNDVFQESRRVRLP